MIIGLNHFHDSLNTVVILGHGCECFSAKCAEFLLTFITERN